MQVEDDGAGIVRDELPLALARHATSKIATLQDLEGVLTMGFRGEALAAIASVSRVSITSRTRDAAHGAAISAEGAQLGSCGRRARAGTTVAVSDLYFTPARRSSPRAAEFGHCDEVFRRIALAQPRIAFQLKHNGRVSHVLRATDRGAGGRASRSVLFQQPRGRGAERRAPSLRPRRHIAGQGGQYFS